MRTRVFALAVLLICSGLVAQTALNNDGVLKLIKAGLSDDLIISTIQASPGAFDTSADGLIALKNGGATEKVLSAILVKASSGTATRGATSSSTPEKSDPPSAPANTTPGTAPDSEPGTSSGTRPVAAGSRVVIAPMGGFETYFAAAVREKKVPVTLTLDKTSAQYFVVSTDTEWQGFVYGSGGSANWSGGSGSAAYGSAASSTRGLEASIMLIDAKTKDVIWAYEVHKNSHGALIFGTFGARGKQSIAEACAKHLKEYIEKGK
jgi:hypothetical protein